ncbi:hypothetical protein ACIRCZ_18635 [Leifsonia sp. NPDC102414]|uniref:hypothetical protein n=1 Tax=Leifsonia sp. NPDC102414 TaxID=3364124 RepID=UPI00382D5001
MGTSKKNRQHKHEAGQRPWRDVSTFAGGPGQKWTRWASWGVVGGLLLVCAAIWVAFPDRAPTPAAGPAPATTTKPSAPASASVCPATVESTEIPQAGPADISWTALYGNAWPTSAAIGPTKTVDGIAQCFQHSPAGAALAAVNIIQSTRTVDTVTAQKILATQFVQNAGLETATAELTKTYATQPPEGRVWGRVVGFKVESYRPDQAVLLLVEYWPQRGQYTGYDVTVAWVDGDWKVQLTSDGQTSRNGDITVDPTGFTRWETPATTR